ncbi:MAG: pesticidal protein Cry7Aa [Nanoarchaeota archaeon]|nr:pesticidal protein Cry7Aa [Nanoarchaeota archaeon]
MRKLTRRLYLKPTDNEWESGAVLNPTAIKEGNTIHLIYRAVKHPNYSSLGHAEIKDGVLHRHKQPFMTPTEEYEKEGIEDPRITKIKDTFYLLYTAWDGRNARVGLATGQSIDKLTKQGIISPNIALKKAIELVNSARYKERWQSLLELGDKDLILGDKDAVLLPEKISGKFVILHRLEPDIQAVYFDSFDELRDDRFWEEYLRNIEDYVIMRPKYKWEDKKIGAGAVALKVQYGWLLLYHGVEGKIDKHIYSAGATLLTHDLRYMTRLEEPLFMPDFEWEKKGDVNNVVFPEGAVIEDGMLNIYYGCADTRIGLAQIRLESLLKELQK